MTRMAVLPPLPYRATGLLAASAAALALGIAYLSETWGGLVPCALCLLERWPYRVAIALGLAASVLPYGMGRVALAMLAMVILTGVGFAAIHAGVEFHWWPSPLPECAAPSFGGGSIAERLSRMPAVPAKPCDEPVFLIPWLPLSMAAMNLLFGAAFAAIVIHALKGRR